MNPLQPGPQPRDFIWASGIEDTFVPQIKPGHRALDEYELIGHYEHWREDLALARELGLRAIRWGVPWYRVEPKPGEFNWHWTDQVLTYLVEQLGITPIIDLMHYGCPFWLQHEFANKHYPRAVASYAAAFARHYAGLVHWYTPLNEPHVNALLCGKDGKWPPYLRGDAGYVRVLLQLIKGITRTVEAIKGVDPDATLVFVEASGLFRAARPEIEALIVEDRLRNYLSFDLLTGRVTPDHPLFPWLIRNRASLDDLALLVRHPVSIDAMGLNFYPQWSTQQLYADSRGRLARRCIEPDGAGFSTLIAEYFQRYHAPILITETSAREPEEERSRWLESSVAAIKRLRGQGIPVLGYTWFPLFTMVDWEYRFGRQPVEQYLLDLGLYKLARRADGRRWQPTPLVDLLREYIADSEAAIGSVIPIPREFSMPGPNPIGNPTITRQDLTPFPEP